MDVPEITVADLPTTLPEDIVVLDVREPSEWAAGHIDGALHVPLADVPQRHEELPRQRTVVVCHLGGRSARATAWLAQQGHDVVNLAGGMEAWEAAGRPVTR